MKKIIALLLCLLMVVGMVACATNTDNNDQTDGSQDTTPATENSAADLIALDILHHTSDAILEDHNLTIHGMLNTIDGCDSVSYPDDRADFLLTGHHIIIFYFCFQYRDNLL